MQRRQEAANQAVARHELVELMPVNSQVTDTCELPGILLIDADADQMRHDLRESVVVVAFYPNHFDFTLGIGEFQNVPQEFPLLFFQPPEIQFEEQFPP